MNIICIHYYQTINVPNNMNNFKLKIQEYESKKPKYFYFVNINFISYFQISFDILLALFNLY